MIMQHSTNIKKTEFLKKACKRLCFFLVLISSLLIQSCRTEIPATDTTPPAFSLRITGDGFDHTFTEADDFSRFELNLKTGAVYNFAYAGSDAGGLKLMQLQVPNDLIGFETPIASPWTESTSGLSRIVSWRGDPALPVRGNLLGGTFRVIGNNSISFDFKFFLQDYGGLPGAVNSISRQLYITSGYHRTEIVYF
jgi:hypothetical protein